MLRGNLDSAVKLFDLAACRGDTLEDGVLWGEKFKDHVTQTLENVRRACLTHPRTGVLSEEVFHNPLEQRLELLRAKLELHDIIADRLENRAMRLDPRLMEGMQALRLANVGIIRELHASARVRAHGAQGLDVLEQQQSTHLEERDASAATPLALPPESRKTAVAWEAPARGREVGEGHLFHSPDRAKVTDVGKPGSRAAIPARQRELSLRQLRTVMASVLESKAVNDRRCATSGAPTKTLAQHLRSWLLARYRQHAIAEEWAQAVFFATRRFANAGEVDVLVFGRILDNCFAESFVGVQDSLRAAVKALLRKILQRHHPLRPQGEIEALLSARTRCGVPLLECEEVVCYLYNDEDAKLLLRRLRRLQSQAAQQVGDVSEEQCCLRYREFLKTLLRFQADLMEVFLGDFVDIFRDVDSDDDGIVSPLQIEEIIHRLTSLRSRDQASTEVVELEKQARAVMARRPSSGMTFSDCVDFLTGLIEARWAVRCAAGEEVRAQALPDPPDEEACTVEVDKEPAAGGMSEVRAKFRSSLSNGLKGGSLETVAQEEDALAPATVEEEALTHSEEARVSEEISNLQRRFPDKTPEEIRSALERMEGHAGRVGKLFAQEGARIGDAV